MLMRQHGGPTAPLFSGMNAPVAADAQRLANGFDDSHSDSCHGDGADWLETKGFPTVEQLLTLRPASVAAVTRSSETFRVDSDRALSDGVPDHIYVKRYYNHRKTRLRGIFRGTFFGKSRVRLEFEHLNNMRRRGVPTVHPIICVENRRWRLLHSSALITEGQPDSEPLDAYYVNHRSLWDRSTHRRFVRAMGLSIAKMHGVGVLHGRLVWRNILVNETEAGDDWTFTFLDPGRHCRCYRSHVPRRGVVSDLSDFVATGMAVQWGTDFARFMRAYCGGVCSYETRKSLAERVVRLARPKSSQESHRVAVSSAMACLQRCIAAAGAAPARFESAESFFEAIAGVQLPDAPRTTWVVQIECTQGGPNHAAISRTLVMAPAGVSIHHGGDARPDLTIQTDSDAWLTIVNARPEALDMIRAGRLKLRGDARPFSLLVKWLETLSDTRSD